jgi:hypothetical protein
MVWHAQYNICKLHVQDPDTPAPVAELWKPAQREKLADMLAATLKQAVGEGACQDWCLTSRLCRPDLVNVPARDVDCQAISSIIKGESGI